MVLIVNLFIGISERISTSTYLQWSYNYLVLRRVFLMSSKQYIAYNYCWYTEMCIHISRISTR